MSSMIWDNSTSAFKNSDTPKSWNGSAYTDTTGYVYQNNAWKEAWSPAKVATLPRLSSGLTYAQYTAGDYYKSSIGTVIQSNPANYNDWRDESYATGNLLDGDNATRAYGTRDNYYYEGFIWNYSVILNTCSFYICHSGYSGTENYKIQLQISYDGSSWHNCGTQITGTIQGNLDNIDLQYKSISVGGQKVKGFRWYIYWTTTNPNNAGCGISELLVS